MKKNYLKLLFLISLLFNQNCEINAQQKMAVGIKYSPFWNKELSHVFDLNSNYATVHSFFNQSMGFEINVPVNQNVNLGLGFNYLYRYLQINMYKYNEGGGFFHSTLTGFELPITASNDFKIEPQGNANLRVKGGLVICYNAFTYNSFEMYHTEQVMSVTIIDKNIFSIKMKDNLNFAVTGGLGLVNNFRKFGKLFTGFSYTLYVSNPIQYTLEYEQWIAGNLIKNNDFGYRSNPSYLSVDLIYYLPFSLFNKKVNQ